jgi:L-amino acid N-acyltransferase YncA/putative methionine-R-sulfoxide reductase with GAF domain
VILLPDTSALADAARAACSGGRHRWAAIYRVTATHVHLLALDGPGPPSHPVFALGKGLSTRAVTERRTVTSNDTATDASYLEAFGDTAAEIIVPVFAGDGSVVGTLDVESDRANAFDEHAVRSLETIAAGLAPAILAANIPEPQRELHLRPVRDEDAEAIARIYAPYVETTADSFEETAPGAAEMRGRFASVTASYPWLVAALDGEVAGYAYGHEHRARPAYRPSVEVSVYVDRSAQRRGIARLLYGALFRDLARRGYHRAFAGITASNEGSIAFHRSVGFSPIGVFHEIGYKFGRWHDTSWWERDLSPIAFPR